MIDPFKSNGLPPRGTGLKTGTTDEKKGGHPRSDEDRMERHKIMGEVKDDSVSMGSSKFVKVERNGRIEYRREGYEDAEFPAPESQEPLKKTKKQLRDERRAKQTAKK